MCQEVQNIETKKHLCSSKVARYAMMAFILLYMHVSIVAYHHQPTSKMFLNMLLLLFGTLT